MVATKCSCQYILLQARSKQIESLKWSGLMFTNKNVKISLVFQLPCKIGLEVLSPYLDLVDNYKMWSSHVCVTVSDQQHELFLLYHIVTNKSRAYFCISRIGIQANI